MKEENKNTITDTVENINVNSNLNRITLVDPQEIISSLNGTSSFIATQTEEQKEKSQPSPALKDFTQSEKNIEEELEKPAGGSSKKNTEESSDSLQQNTIITWKRTDANKLPDADRLNDPTEKTFERVETSTFFKKEKPLFIETIANPDTFFSREDEVLHNINVLLNDTSFDTTSIQDYDKISLNGGQVILASDSTFSYTPAQDFNGTDSFSYTIIDIGGNPQTATVTIIIAAVNDGTPVAKDEYVSTQEDTPIVNLNAIASDRIIDEASIVQYDTESINGGQILQTSPGIFTYTPALNFHGSDIFTYTLQDTDGETSSATINITVTPVNDGTPSANDDLFYTQEDTAIEAINVIANDTIIDEASVVEYDVESANGGQISQTAPGIFSYAPAPNFHGVDTFTYTLQDTDGETSSATINITVTPVDDGAPSANDDAFNTLEDTALEAINVIANDTIIDEASVVGYDAESVNGGQILHISPGIFTYTPALNFNGTDTFTYTLQDTDGETSSATINITVTPVTDGTPIAKSDELSTLEDTHINVFNVIANDLIFDDAIIVAYDNESENGGLISQRSPETFSYTPAPNYYGVDTFTYTLRDSDGEVAHGTISITVEAIDDGTPSATNDNTTIDEDSSQVIDILSNDNLLDGAYIDSIDNLSAHGGQIIQNIDHTITYVPTENYHGIDTFTYTIKDNDGQTSTATVTVTVNSINDVPVNTVTESVVVPRNGTLLFNESTGYVLSIGDVDHNITEVTVSVTHGTLTITGDDATVTNNNTNTISITGTQADINQALNTLQYQPNNHFGGFDELILTTQDSDGDIDRDSVSIKVQVDAEAAVFNNDTTSPASTGLVAHQYATNSVYSSDHPAIDDASTIKEDIDHSGQEPATQSRSIQGVGALAQTTTIDQTNSIALNSENGNVYTLKGLVYLEEGSLYRFSGDRDDALYIELGGQQMVNTYGNSSGKFSTFVDDKTKNIHDIKNIVENDFTPTTSGYYTLEVYAANLVGIGGIALNLSVNNTDYILSAENFSLYTNAYEIIQAGGVLESFTANTNEEGNPQGGYFAHNNNAHAIGIEGQDVTLHNFSVRPESEDELTSLIINVPINATLYDTEGNIFLSQAGHTSIDIIANHWTLNGLHIALPDAVAGDQVNLHVTATTQSISLDTTETASIFSINILPIDFIGNIESDISTIAATGDDILITGSGFDDTLHAESSGNSIIIGRDGNDHITGNDGDNTLYGGKGNDHIIAGAGSDIIFSGLGSDTLDGGDDTDVDHFIWLESDDDASTDTLTNFIYGVGGDLIDLHDLLDGETSETINNFITFSDSTLHIDTNGDGSGFTDLSIKIENIGDVSLDDLLAHNIVIDTGRTILRGDIDGDNIYGRAFNGVTTNEDFYGGGSGDNFWGNGGADRYIIEASDNLEYVFDPATLNTQSTMRVQDFFTFGLYDGISEVDALDLHDVLIGEEYNTIDNYLSINTHFSFGGVYFNVDINGDGSGTDFYIHLKQDNLDIEAELGYTDDTQQLEILQLLIDNGNIVID